MITLLSVIDLTMAIPLASQGLSGTSLGILVSIYYINSSKTL